MASPAPVDRAVPSTDLSPRLWAFLSALVLAVLLGSWLRVWRIDEQIIMEDEWHGLLIMRDRSWGFLASHFGLNDHCIPLTLWHKFLDSTLGIDELLLRLVPLVSGVLLLVLLPLYVRPALGSLTAALFAALLAGAPLLTFFSRYARPYAPALLSTWTAVLALDAWHRHRRGHAGFVFVVSAAFTVWLMPAFAPFLLAAWACGPWSAKWAGLGVAAGAMGALLLGPALLCDLASLRAKAGGTTVGVFALDGALALFAGVAPRTLAGALAIIALAGYRIGHRRAPQLVGMLAVASLVQVLTIFFSEPIGANGPMIFARYALPALPFFLLVVAHAFARSILRTNGRRRTLHSVFVALCLITCAAFGPWQAAYWMPNQWTGHSAYQADYDTDRDRLEAALVPSRVSEAYRALASLPPCSTIIVETPFPQSFEANPYTVLQHHHKQRVIAGLAADLVPGTLPGLPRSGDRRFPRWSVSLTDIAALKRAGASYVFVHKDLPREFPRLQFQLSTEARPLLVHLTQALGRPHFEDDLLAVWDLR